MVGLVQAFGSFRGALTIISMQFVSKFAQNNYKNELAKCYISEGGSDTPKGDVNECTAKFYELFMITYFWSCCVKKKKLDMIDKFQK